MTGELADDPGPPEVERVMAELVYEHLIDLVDFDRMHQLEEVVAQQLYGLVDNGRLPAITEDDVPDHAARLVARAWNRVIEDPRRYVDFRGEWEPDEDCELCKALAATAQRTVS